MKCSTSKKLVRAARKLQIVGQTIFVRTPAGSVKPIPSLQVKPFQGFRLALRLHSEQSLKHPGSVRSLFLRERRGEVSATQFDQTFGLPENFDYLE